MLPYGSFDNGIRYILKRLQAARIICLLITKPLTRLPRNYLILLLLPGAEVVKKSAYSVLALFCQYSHACHDEFKVALVSRNWDAGAGEGGRDRVVGGWGGRTRSGGRG